MRRVAIIIISLIVLGTIYWLFGANYDSLDFSYYSQDERVESFGIPKISGFSWYLTNVIKPGKAGMYMDDGEQVNPQKLIFVLSDKKQVRCPEYAEGSKELLRGLSLVSGGEGRVYVYIWINDDLVGLPWSEVDSTSYVAKCIKFATLSRLEVRVSASGTKAPYLLMGLFPMEIKYAD